MKIASLVKRILWTVLALLLVLVGWIVWSERPVDEIITGGSFERDFAAPERGLYPEKPQEIEAWFRAAVPKGATKEEARRILSASFVKDLTTGRQVTIERTSTLAGGSFTKVRLLFDKEGRFQDVRVEQRWAYL